MAEESIVGLVRDLSTKLSAIADEFGTRVEQIAVPSAAGTTEPAPDKHALAEQLLAHRAARFDFFPSELFHEPAWDMLLALYLADEDGRTMNVKTLVGAANAPVTTSQRWIDHLHKLRLVDRVVDPVDRRRVEVSLSLTGREAIVNYLRQIGAG